MHTLNCIKYLPITSYILSTCHSASLLTLSYAFSRFIRPIYTLPFFKCALSSISFTVKTWPTHPYIYVKPSFPSSIKPLVTQRIQSTKIPLYIYTSQYLYSSYFVLFTLPLRRGTITADLQSSDTTTHITHPPDPQRQSTTISNLSYCLLKVKMFFLLELTKLVDNTSKH